MKRSLLAAVIGITTFVSTTRRASAQPAVDELYADAKEIITELIERDVAESIAPNLACYSPGGLLKYFPQTLQAIYERNFGALKDVLRREVIAFAGNYAFESFRQRRSIGLGEFLPAVEFSPSTKNDPCKTGISDLGGPAAYQEDLARKRRSLNGGVYLPLDACSVPEGPGAGLELPCFFAQAVIASTSGRSAETQELLGTAVAIKAADLLKANKLPIDASYLRRTMIDEVRARFANGTFSPDGPLAPFAVTELAEALKVASNPLKEILATRSSSLRIRAGALHLLLAPADGPAITVPDSSGPKGKSKPIRDLVAYLKGLSRDQLPVQGGEAPGAGVARALLVQAAEVPRGTVTVRVKERGADIAFDTTATAVSFTGPGLGRLQDLHEMARMAAQFEHLVGEATQGDTSKKALLQAVIGLVQSLDSLGATLKSAAKVEANGFDLMTLLDAVVRGCGKHNDAASSDDEQSTPIKRLSLCDVWNQAIGLMDPEGQLRPILAAARDRNYRALAVNAVSAVFSGAADEAYCCGKDKSCAETAKLYGRLAKSFVSYVLMPRDDSDASLAARVAFKSAAVDVIRSVGKRGGLERPFWGGVFLPTASLRASWSGSYQDEDARGTGLRFVPTVDWPTFRIPLTTADSPVFFGGAITLVDGLAPLAEIVSRQSSPRYIDKWYILATLVQPRISGIIAFPSFTKHTALTLGASLRGAAPFDLERKEGDRPVFGYATVAGTNEINGKHDFGDRFSRLLEVSAAVQYIP